MVAHGAMEICENIQFGCADVALTDSLKVRTGMEKMDAAPRKPVIPRLGLLHGTLSRFTPSQALISRLGVGPDVYRFERLVDHTDALRPTNNVFCQEKIRGRP